MPDTAGIVPDTAGIVPDTAGIVPDTELSLILTVITHDPDVGWHYVIDTRTIKCYNPNEKSG